MKTLIYLFISFYYACTISYLYSHILTPRMCSRKNNFICLVSNFAVISLSIFHPFISFRGILCLLSMLLSIFAYFKDSLFKKTICLIMVYVTETLIEALSYLFTDLIYYIYTGEVYSSNFLQQVPFWVTCTMCLFIFLFGIIFLPPLSKLYAKWLHHRLSKALISISFPLIIPFCTGFLYELSFAHTYPSYILILSIGIYLLSYIPAYHGIITLYQQAQEYYLAQKEYSLIEQQMAFSNEIENQFKKIRKWNHDLNNHLFSLSCLFENERYSEAEEYLASLLQIKTKKK